MRADRIEVVAHEARLEHGPMGEWRENDEQDNERRAERAEPPQQRGAALGERATPRARALLLRRPRLVRTKRARAGRVRVAPREER